MADQTKEVTRLVVAPALVADLGKDVLVYPPVEGSVIGTWFSSFRFPPTESRVKALVDEARQNVKEGRKSTAYVKTQYTFQCTEDVKEDRQINQDKCSLVGVQVSLLEPTQDNGHRGQNVKNFLDGKDPDVKFGRYEPSYYERALQATGEKLYDFSDWLAKISPFKK